MSKTISDSNFANVKLTDAQLKMMHAALQREDRCLTPVASLRGAQLIKTGQKLITAGWVREVKAKPDYPVWRRDEDGNAAFALKLTAAGAKMAATDAETFEEKTSSGDEGSRILTELATSPSDEAVQAIAAPSGSKDRDRSPRPSSKIATVIELLGRSQGATLADLIAATGWLPHTTRAALTGLRKRGYAVTLDRSDRANGSVYRIEVKPTAGLAIGTASATESA